jgi:hypothetical protein
MRPNHWVERPAASFGWIVEAAAAHPPALGAPDEMYQKLTIKDSSGTVLVIRDDLTVNSKDASASARLKSDVDDICAKYKDRGASLTTLSFDLAMELIARGWIAKSLESAIGAGDTFLIDAENLLVEGQKAELRSNTSKGMPALLDIFTMQRCYRMSTLSLSFACEATCTGSSDSGRMCLTPSNASHRKINGSQFLVWQQAAPLIRPKSHFRR